MRIKYVIPFPFDNVGIGNRSAQIPTSILSPGTTVTCATVRNNVETVESFYEAMLFDSYITDEAIRAEDEGYDAVIMDTASDSGRWAIRSRIRILALGPGLVSYAIALMLGKRFSIITMWDGWRHLYEKNMDTYHLWEKCASIRAIGVRPDQATLLSGKEDRVFPALKDAAVQAINEDRADVILLGSTTMHQAGKYLADQLDVPVINPGQVAIKMAETLFALGLTHSKAAFPEPVTIRDDLFASLAGSTTRMSETLTPDRVPGEWDGPG